MNLWFTPNLATPTNVRFRGNAGKPWFILSSFSFRLLTMASLSFDDFDTLCNYVKSVLLLTKKTAATQHTASVYGQTQCVRFRGVKTVCGFPHPHNPHTVGAKVGCQDTSAPNNWCRSVRTLRHQFFVGAELSHGHFGLVPNSLKTKRQWSV